MAAPLSFSFIYLLLILLVVVCWLYPAILVYRLPRLTGWRKPLLGVACFISAFALPVLFIFGIKGAPLDPKEARSLVSSYAVLFNISMFIVPWFVYWVLKKKYGHSNP